MARRLSRRVLEVRFFGTAIRRGSLLEIAKLRPAGIEVLAVIMRGRIGAVQGLAADRAEAQTVGTAENLLGQGKDQSVMRPSDEVERSLVDVRADQFGCARLVLILFIPAGSVGSLDRYRFDRLVHLPDVNGNIRSGVLQAAKAGAGQTDLEAETECVPGAGPGHIELELRLGGDRLVILTAQRHAIRSHLPHDPGGVAVGKPQGVEINLFDQHLFPAWQTNTMRPMPTPDDSGYLDSVRGQVPLYDALQDAAIEAVPFEPVRVLELGVGTGETASRLLNRFPDARVTGLDSDPDMLFKAREIVDEVSLARMEDPLPDGPWDLVLSVLSVHRLTDEQKQSLFRRVRQQSKALVIGDFVSLGDDLGETRVSGRAYPDTAANLARWCDGEVVWSDDDLVVIVADYR